MGILRELPIAPRRSTYGVGFGPSPLAGVMTRTPRTPASPGMSQNARYASQPQENNSHVTRFVNEVLQRWKDFQTKRHAVAPYHQLSREELMDWYERMVAASPQHEMEIDSPDDVHDLAAVVSGRKPAALVNAPFIENHPVGQELLRRAHAMGLSVGKGSNKGEGVHSSIVGNTDAVGRVVSGMQTGSHSEIGLGLGYHPEGVDDFVKRVGPTMEPTQSSRYADDSPQMSWDDYVADWRKRKAEMESTMGGELAHWNEQLRQRQLETAQQMEQSVSDARALMQQHLASGTPADHPYIKSLTDHINAVSQSAADRRLLAQGDAPPQPNPTNASRYARIPSLDVYQTFPDAVATDPRHIRPINDTIPAKVQSIASSMSANGWQGKPLLAVGNQALTGSHRLAAAERAGIPVPIVFLDSGEFLDAAKRVHALKPEANPHKAVFADIQLPDDETRLKVVQSMSHPVATDVLTHEIHHNNTMGKFSGKAHYARGVNYGETTEDEFHRLLDANPEDHLTRQVFADWLQERNDPRAEGYRALGKLGKRAVSWVNPNQRTVNYPDSWYWGDVDNRRNSDSPDNTPGLLDHRWLTEIKASHPSPTYRTGTNNELWRHHETRREAEDAAAHAFATLPPEEKQRILTPTQQQPTQSARNGRRGSHYS